MILHIHGIFRIDTPKADEEEIAQAAADIADEEAATAGLRSREESGENSDEGGAAVDDAEASETEETKAEPPKDDEIKVGETKPESPKDEESKAEEPKAEPPKAGETEAEPPRKGETKAEEPKAEEPRADEPPEADGAKDKEAAPAEAAAAPRKNLSLVDAAVEVLRTEKRPMGVKELVKLDGQQLVVPLGDFGGPVVRDAERLYLFGRQIVRHDARDLLKLQRLGGENLGMPGHDHPVPVYDDGVAEAELPYRAGDGVHRARVVPRVVRVWRQFRGLPHHNLHVSSPALLLLIPFGGKIVLKVIS